MPSNLDTPENKKIHKSSAGSAGSLTNEIMRRCIVIPNFLFGKTEVEVVARMNGFSKMMAIKLRDTSDPMPPEFSSQAKLRKAHASDRATLLKALGRSPEATVK